MRRGRYAAETSSHPVSQSVRSDAGAGPAAARGLRPASAETPYALRHYPSSRRAAAPAQPQNPKGGRATTRLCSTVSRSLPRTTSAAVWSRTPTCRSRRRSGRSWRRIAVGSGRRSLPPCGNRLLASSHHAHHRPEHPPVPARPRRPDRHHAPARHPRLRPHAVLRYSAPSHPREADPCGRPHRQHPYREPAFPFELGALRRACNLARQRDRARSERPRHRDRSERHSRRSDRLRRPFPPAPATTTPPKNTAASTAASRSSSKSRPDRIGAEQRCKSL